MYLTSSSQKGSHHPSLRTEASPTWRSIGTGMRERLPATEAAFIQIAEGEGQAVIDRLDNAPPGPIETKWGRRVS